MTCYERPGLSWQIGAKNALNDTLYWENAKCRLSLPSVFRDMLSSSFNGLLILIPGMGRLVGAGPPTAAEVAEPPIMNGHGYGGRGE